MILVENVKPRALAFAPRVDSRLLEALARLDDPDVPIAETYRRLGPVARALQLFRPSYEHVRRLVHAIRRMGRFPSAAAILLDVVARSRPPDALLDYVLGGIVPPQRRPAGARSRDAPVTR